MSTATANSAPNFGFAGAATISDRHCFQSPHRKRSSLMGIPRTDQHQNVPTLIAASSSSNIMVPTPKKKTRKKYYAKKPDPSALKTTHLCSECGKEFWSSKALFGHMRCHPERQWRGMNPPPNLPSPLIKQEEDKEVINGEDNEIASCLLMLANGPDNKSHGATTASLGFDDYHDHILETTTTTTKTTKSFGFQQALGQQRENFHEEIKNHDQIIGSCGEEVSGHKCNICFRVFSSGQALGGHKRCHWEKEEIHHEPIKSSSDVMSLNSVNEANDDQLKGSRLVDFDLNLPADEATTTMELDYSNSSSYPSGLTLALRLGL